MKLAQTVREQPAEAIVQRQHQLRRRGVRVKGCRVHLSKLLRKVEDDPFEILEPLRGPSGHGPERRPCARVRPRPPRRGVALGLVPVRPRSRLRRSHLVQEGFLLVHVNLVKTGPLAPGLRFEHGLERGGLGWRAEGRGHELRLHLRHGHVPAQLPQQPVVGPPPAPAVTEPGDGREFLLELSLLQRAPSALPDAQPVHRAAQEERAALVRGRRRGRRQARRRPDVLIAHLVARVPSPRRAVLPAPRPGSGARLSAVLRREDTHDPVEPAERGSHVRGGPHPRAD